MKFNLVKCPECNKQIITELMICGTPCSCGKTLYDDTDDNRKDVEKEWKEESDAFSRNFEEFQHNMKRAEKHWNDGHIFVKYKIVDIPDEKLIELVN